MRKNVKKYLTALIVAIMAAAVTRGALYVWANKDNVPTAATSPVKSKTTDENSDSVRLEVEDHLSEEGWLLAKADSGTVLRYAVIPGKTIPEPLEVDWQKMGRLFHDTDTLYPKCDCVVAIQAEKDGKIMKKSLTFDYCAFVERLLRSNNSNAGTVLRQLLFSFSQTQPLVISYDYLIEDSCKLQEDMGIFDILHERLDEEADIPCHVDSIRSYTTASPCDEALLKTYPPVAFINFSSPR